MYLIFALEHQWSNHMLHYECVHMWLHVCLFLFNWNLSCCMPKETVQCMPNWVQIDQIEYILNAMSGHFVSWLLPSELVRCRELDTLWPWYIYVCLQWKYCICPCEYMHVSSIFVHLLCEYSEYCFMVNYRLVLNMVNINVFLLATCPVLTVLTTKQHVFTTK